MMKSRQISPILNLLHERSKFNEMEITTCENVTMSDIDDAINLINYDMMPHLRAYEKPDGTWCIVNGGLFIKSLLAFINDEYRYAENGLLEDYQGKCFSELNRTQQRQLREAKLTMQLVDIVDSELSLLTELSKASLRLS
jgi:hypothetical protein